MSSLPKEEGEELQESETEEELEEEPPASQFKSYNAANGTTASISCVNRMKFRKGRLLKAQIFSIILNLKKGSCYPLLP